MNPRHARQALCALFLTFSLFLLTALHADAAVPDKPAEREYVVDTANLVSTEDRATIGKIGEDLREKTKAEIVVVTVATLDGTDIESYANELFRKWGIGNKQADNGVLLLIAKDDRKFRIEVGYGLEGEITDGRAGEILDKMKPYFRDGKYSAGVLDAYQKLAAYAYHAAGIKPEASVDVPPATAPAEEEEETSLLMNVLYLILAIAGLFLFAIAFHWVLDIIDRALGPGGSSGGGGNHSSDGGSGSGGGSSRGGYGGGSSGGGGASGGW